MAGRPAGPPGSPAEPLGQRQAGAYRFENSLPLSIRSDLREIKRLADVRPHGSLLMPILTAALAAGGLALLPVEINSAINGIQTVGPRRLDITYEGYLPLPVIGTRIKAANANISAWIGPSAYNIASRAEAAGIVGWFVDYNLTISATGAVGT